MAEPLCTKWRVTRSKRQAGGRAPIRRVAASGGDSDFSPEQGFGNPYDDLSGPYASLYGIG